MDLRSLPPLPEEAASLLHELGAPPRLVAHLTLVHDVAHRLSEALAARWPALAFDRAVVLLGAATHDVGKVIHPEELTGPGHRHEEAGAELLRERGLPEPVARIARTHRQWHAEASPQLEDLLVALADAIWKGTRDERLEATVVSAITPAIGAEEWMVHAKVDDVLTKIAEGAEHRVLWQAAHPA